VDLSREEEILEEERNLAEEFPLIAQLGRSVRRINNNDDYMKAESFLIKSLRTLRLAKEKNKT